MTVFSASLPPDEIQHDQAARSGALRARDVGEERWRGEADGERRDAAANEVSTCDGHRRSRYMN